MDKNGEGGQLNSMKDFVLNLASKNEKRNIYGFSLLVLETEREERINVIRAEEPLIITEFSR